MTRFNYFHVNVYMCMYVRVYVYLQMQMHICYNCILTCTYVYVHTYANTYTCSARRTKARNEMDHKHHLKKRTGEEKGKARAINHARAENENNLPPSPMHRSRSN